MAKKYKVIVLDPIELSRIENSMEVISSNLQAMKDNVDGASELKEVKDVVYSYMEHISNELSYIKDELKPDEMWLN